MRALWFVAAFMLMSCGSAPEKKAAAPPPAAPVVKDNRLRLVADNQVSARLVPDHILDKKVLPGGTVGEYAAEGRKYQMFIIETPSAQDAAILLLDVKTALSNPAYIAYMGGYFATDNGTPVYIFAKSKYLAGVVGLAEDLADPIARQLAAKL